MAAPKQRRITPADLAYWFGDRVYLRVSLEREPGLVTEIRLSPGTAAYTVTWPSGDSTHYEFELSSTYEPDFGVEEAE